MRLKRQSEIAIGILATCARSPDTKFPAQQIAQEIGATKDHAYQVVALLVRNGLLHSERGPGGGVRLAVDPAKIKLVDVLRITQPDLDGDGSDNLSVGPAGNRALLDNIVAATSSFFVRLLDRFTIADLVAPRDGLDIACLKCRLVPPLSGHDHTALLRETVARTGVALSADAESVADGNPARSSTSH